MQLEWHCTSHCHGHFLLNIVDQRITDALERKDTDENYPSRRNAQSLTVQTTRKLPPHRDESDFDITRQTYVELISRDKLEEEGEGCEGHRASVCLFISTRHEEDEEGEQRREEE